MNAPRSRLSYANVMATIAVFIALGGVGYAAINIPAGSVGSKEIKNGAIKGIDVQAQSLKLSDFDKPGALKGERGPRGPVGDTGKKGAKGATGPRGATGVAGASGAAGATGATGPEGSVSSPSDLFRTNNFSNVAPGASPGATMTTVTFTPAKSGNALVRARGDCTIARPATGVNHVALLIGTNASEALSNAPPGGAGGIRLGGPEGDAFDFLGWTAERVMPVTAGTPTTIGLFGIEMSGSVPDCSGTLTVEAVF